MIFEWNEGKRLANIAKHGPDFRDASKLFAGPYLIMQDPRRDYGEIRFNAFGRIDGRMMVLTFTGRGDKIRIISMRKANKREQEKFKKAIADRLEQDRQHEG